MATWFSQVGSLTPHLRIGEVAFQEVGAHFQRAGTADGLNGGDTPLLQHRVLRAEQQMLDGGAIGLQPFHRQVYRGAVLDAVQLRLRRGDRPHLRNDALRIVVQADTQVYLVRARVLFEFFHQRQNGIAGIGVNVLEHGVFLLVYLLWFGHSVTFLI